jgi:hypothetical protein
MPFLCSSVWPVKSDTQFPMLLEHLINRHCTPLENFTLALPQRPAWVAGCYETQLGTPQCQPLESVL